MRRCSSASLWLSSPSSASYSVSSVSLPLRPGYFALTLFIAVQEGLDLSIGKTFVVVAISLFFYLIGLGVILQDIL